MARYKTGDVGTGESGGGAGAWTKEIEVDFRALTPTSWGLADVGTKQDVDGYKFDLFGIAGAEVLEVGDAALGMTGDAPGGTLSWRFNDGPNAIDLTSDDYIAIVYQVFEANPWSGQAGVQVGDTAGGSFNFGGDLLRTNLSTYQVARRTTGTSFISAAVPLPGAPGNWRTVLLVLGRVGITMFTRNDVLLGVLPPPDDPAWGDGQRIASVGVNHLAAGGRDWDGADGHLALWHSGHAPAGSYYSLANAAIYSAPAVRS